MSRNMKPKSYHVVSLRIMTPYGPGCSHLTKQLCPLQTAGNMCGL